MAKTKKVKSAKHSLKSKGHYGWKSKFLFTLTPIVMAWAGWFFLRSKPSSLVLAKHTERLTRLRSHNITCSQDYNQHPIFKGCTPTSKCARTVIDGLVSADEVNALRDLVKGVMKHGGSAGGASIVDLHSGALSMGTKFVNIYNYLSQEQLRTLFTRETMQIYSSVKQRIKEQIALVHGINPSALHLTSPTFFSRMTGKAAETQHDEYWHVHIDKIQYGSFDYTSLLYLSTYSEEFNGGRFIFDDGEEGQQVVEPRRGRVSFFTSGSENPHHVEKMQEGGVRLALTVAFTCDVAKAIEDPKTIE